jgi:hypothetical protein
VSGTDKEQDLGEWCLDRVILKTESFSQDLRFSRRSTLAETMSQPALDGFQGYLPQDTQKFIISSKDAAFDLGELILQGLIATGLEVVRGVQRVILSFKGVIGGLSALFAPNRAPDALGNLECALSTKTINDVLLPALNVAVTEPALDCEDDRKRLSCFIETLKGHREDIVFYMSLLSRFVAAKEGQSKTATSAMAALAEEPSYARVTNAA